MKKYLTILFLLISTISYSQIKVLKIHGGLDTASMLSTYLRKIDTTNKWVNSIANNATHDSLIYFIGSTRYAVKAAASQVLDTTAQSGMLKGSALHIVTAIPSVDYSVVDTIKGTSGYGNIVSITNPTTIPVINVATDTTVIASKAYARSVGGNGIDSVRLKLGTDTINQWKAGTATFAFRKLNWFNFKDFGGVPGGSSATNTTALQNALNAASSAGGGTVYIPSGTYGIDSVNYSSLVSIVGDGYSSILKGNSAKPMITSSGTVNNYGNIRNLVIDGNNIATIGLNMVQTDNFTYDNIVVQNFTQYCVKMLGAEIGSISNSKFTHAPTCIYANSTGGYKANLIAFYNCTIGSGSNWGIDWNDGSGVTFISVNFGQCGTSGNSSTGAIQFSNMSASAEGVSASFEHSWMEGNYGSEIRINPPSGTSYYYIDKCIFIPQVGKSYAINSFNGGNIYINKCRISGSDSSDVKATGASSIVTNLYSTIATTSFTSGATYVNNTNGNFSANTVTVFNTVGSGFITKATSSYRNYAPNDMVFYTGDNMRFLSDNSAKSINFAVGLNTPALNIYSNYVNAPSLSLGTGTSRYGYLSLPANNAAAGGAGVYFTPGGVLNTTSQNGAMEYSTKLYFNYASGRTPLLDSTTAATTYAPLASPALTGAPTAPTPLLADSSNAIETSAGVKQQIAANTDTLTAIGSLHVKYGTKVDTLYSDTANATTDGILLKADWNTFNNKQAALVSQSNIKSVDSISILGSGDLGTKGDMLRLVQELGSNIVATSVGSEGSFNAVNNMVSATLNLNDFLLKNPATIHGITFSFGGNVPNFTASGYNGVGLYTVNANGTYTLVASTTSDTTMFHHSNTDLSVTFSSAYTAAAGVYAIGFLYQSSSETLAPQLYRGISMGRNNVGAALPNSLKLFSTITAQTTLPASFAASTTAGQNVSMFFTVF